MNAATSIFYVLLKLQHYIYHTTRRNTNVFATKWLILQLFLQYVDLDEFLSENGVSMDGLGSHGTLGTLGSSHGVPKRERSPSPSDCMSPDTMNPPSPADSSVYMYLIISKSRGALRNQLIKQIIIISEWETQFQWFSTRVYHALITEKLCAVTELLFAINKIRRDSCKLFKLN